VNSSPPMRATVSSSSTQPEQARVLLSPGWAAVAAKCGPEGVVVIGLKRSEVEEHQHHPGLCRSADCSGVQGDPGNNVQ